MTEERSRETPQRVRALRVAPIFGPRGVAKLLRSATACGEMGTPQPHQACAWLLAIFRKLTAPWHTRVSQQSPRQRARQRGRLRRALGFPTHSIGCRYILPALRILETRRAGVPEFPSPESSISDYFLSFRETRGLPNSGNIGDWSVEARQGRHAPDAHHNGRIEFPCAPCHNSCP